MKISISKGKALKIIFYITNTAFSILNILINSSFKHRLKRKNHGDICYILGNGPSLDEDMKNENITCNNKNLFAVNLFANTDYYTILKPSHYLLIDPIILMNLFIDEETSKKTKQLFNSIKEKTNWPLIIYIPFKIYKKKNITQLFIENKYITITPFNTTNIKSSVFIRNLCYRFNLGAPITNNVLGAALYIAIMYRFKTVHIVGADHSWTKDLFVNKYNQVCLADSHFYDTNTEQVKPWKKADGNYFKIHQILMAFSTMFYAYEELRIFADKQGTKIINHTKNSFIDAFERNET